MERLQSEVLMKAIISTLDLVWLWYVDMANDVSKRN